MPSVFLYYCSTRYPAAAAEVATVSLGDEITIVGKGNDTTFHAWCQEEKVSQLAPNQHAAAQHHGRSISPPPLDFHGKRCTTIPQWGCCD